MAVFELYIDGVQMNDVPKFNDFTETLERDFNVRGLVLKYPNNLILFGDAFKYLYDKWNETGYCQVLEVIIQKLENGEKTRIDGTIFLSDVSWDWDSGSVEVTIEDNSWSARIFNNWQIPINLLSTKTKNGEDITPPGTLTLEVYDPNAALATYLVTTPEGVSIEQALLHMVKWATDNVVTFQSDFLQDLKDNEYRVLVTTGNSIRTGIIDTYEYSLEQILTPLMKMYNLWFKIVSNKNGTYTFKLEPWEDLFDDEPSLQFSEVKGVNQNTVAEWLYGGVKVGGNAKKDLDGTLALPYYRMTTFVIEDYYFAGNCNLSALLDLTYNPVVDSNIIEDIAVNGNDDYDDDIFFIQFTEPSKGNFRAVKNKYADFAGSGTAPFYYNEPFLNDRILNRYELPNNLLQTFGGDDDTFAANLTASSGALSATPNVISPLIFDNELYDVAGAYNPVSGKYTAGANGTFAFELDLYAALTTNLNLIDTLTIKATLNVRDSGGTLRYAVDGPENVISGASRLTATRADDLFHYKADWVQYMDLNATAEIQVTFTLNDDVQGSTRYQYYAASTFKCTATWDGGGEFIRHEPNDYKCIVIGFSEGIGENDWNDIKNNPTAKILIDRNGNKTMEGWVKKIDRNILTSQVEVEILTNLAQSNKIGI